MTLHGTLHIVFGAIGFLTLMAACFVFARSFHVQKKKAWAIFCGMVGLMFLAAFLIAGRTARLGQDTSSISSTLAIRPHAKPSHRQVVNSGARHPLATIRRQAEIN